MISFNQGLNSFKNKWFSDTKTHIGFLIESVCNNIQNVVDWDFEEKIFPGSL